MSGHLTGVLKDILVLADYRPRFYSQPQAGPESEARRPLLSHWRGPSGMPPSVTLRGDGDTRLGIVDVVEDNDIFQRGNELRFEKKGSLLHGRDRPRQVSLN